LIGYLVQHSPQDRRGFETFFSMCLDGLNDDPQAWVFLRGDGIYQGLRDQVVDEPSFSIPVHGGWRALLARGVQVYVCERCARLRGLGKSKYFLKEAKLVRLDQLVRLTLKADKVKSL
jgi:sulfur relay (sulfurtransferase) complex TusBCD TusD component (DsrE family)